MNHEVAERLEELERDLENAQADNDRALADQIMAEIESIVVQEFHPEIEVTNFGDVGC